VFLLFGNGGVVYAQSAPTPPSAPTAPAAPTPPPMPTPPSAPTAPAAPTPPPMPTPPSAPTAPAAPTPAPSNSPINEATPTPSASPLPVSSAAPSPSSQPLTNSAGVIDNSTGGQDGNSGSGATINTGDATNSAAVLTNANSNSLILGSGNGSGVSVVNDGNGSNSENNGNVSTTNDSKTIQDNVAAVDNDLVLTTNTGNNSASKNVGGDNLIITGDANTSATVVTAVNTNIDGVAVSEFNIVDDHVGDIVLDFPSGCVSGCANFGNSSAVNSGNGDSSQNTAGINSLTNDATFQTNTADIENNLYLAANSGDNTASRNTGGDSSITTGDANVVANVLTLANNNLAGNVIYSVVNVFGDLVGDIIMPEEYFNGLVAANSGNGTGSTNLANASSETNNLINQNNTADIQNNLNFIANTGDNDVSRNTNGDNSVTTGDASVTAQVLNVVNTNIVGGDWWIVLVNEAGNWIGKILGATEGSNYAGSNDFRFTVDEAGQIIATNSGNGAESNNNSTVDQLVNNSVNQTNTANVVNNLNLVANTGDNIASRNTGGNSSVTTGDANIVANLVNFINNNITGGGRLFVTVVNVFGSWAGDFVSPGTHKENTPVVAQNSESPGNEIGGYVAETQNGSSNGGNASSPTVSYEIASGENVLHIATNNGGYQNRNVSGMTSSVLENPEASLVAGDRAGKLNINLALAIPFILLFVLYLGIKRTVAIKFNSGQVPWKT